MVMLVLVMSKLPTMLAELETVKLPVSVIVTGLLKVKVCDVLTTKLAAESVELPSVTGPAIVTATPLVDSVPMVAVSIVAVDPETVTEVAVTLAPEDEKFPPTVRDVTLTVPLAV